MERDKAGNVGKSFCVLRRTLLEISLIGGIIFSLAVTVTSAPTRADEVSDSWPLPPGKNAKLVKEVCKRCHSAIEVVMRGETVGYDEEDARRYYEFMAQGDPNSEEGKKVIEYLFTVLGPK